MGLTKKLATKARTASKTGATQLPQPWHEAGQLAASAIVRAAVTTIGQLGLRSSGFTGRDAFGMNSSRLATDSTLWAHQDGQGIWLIALGKDTVTGPTYDWHIRLTIDAAAQTATIDTLSYISSDGALLNSNSYSELRKLLLDNLAVARTPTGRAEHEITAASLPAATITPYAQRPIDHALDATITTTLSTIETERQLQLLPFNKATGIDNLAWTLLPHAGSNSKEPDIVRGTIADDSHQRSLHLSGQLTPTGDTIRDLRAAERAYAIPRAVHRAIKLADDTATLTDTGRKPS